jgi:hypothetical protein
MRGDLQLTVLTRAFESNFATIWTEMSPALTHLKSNSPSLDVFGIRRKRQTTASGLPPQTLPTLPGTSKRWQPGQS